MIVETREGAPDVRPPETVRAAPEVAAAIANQVARVRGARAVPAPRKVAAVTGPGLRAAQVGRPLGNDQRAAVVAPEKVDQRAPRVSGHLRAPLSIARLLAEAVVHVTAAGVGGATDARVTKPAT